MQHQVKRKLGLVKSIGATTDNQHLDVCYNKNCIYTVMQKLASIGVDCNKDLVILHPGVSELKREYPVSLWVETIKLIYRQTGAQLLITGSPEQRCMAKNIQKECGEGVFCVAGLLNIEEVIGLIKHAMLVISVNTGIVHIAAATILLWLFYSHSPTRSKHPGMYLQQYCLLVWLLVLKVKMK